MLGFTRELTRTWTVFPLAVATIGWAVICPAAVTLVETIDPTPGFSQYVANRAPLAHKSAGRVASRRRQTPGLAA